MIPLYGFLEGDTLGLLILADPAETVASLAKKLQKSASLRVAPLANPRVRAGDRILSGNLRVGETGLTALDCFEVVEGAR